MRLFNRADPDGYPETASAWISAGTLAERLRFVQALLLPPGSSGRTDAGESQCNPALLPKEHLPTAQWQDPVTIADFFLATIFPGEGLMNLASYRNAAVRYLNTDDDGVTASPLDSLSPTGTPYDLRIRGMVAALLIAPRFQEQ